jgi:myo-inositol-1(or 4)-monophosphatase
MPNPSRFETLLRIQAALEAAREVFSRFPSGAIAAAYKAGHDPVTEVDRAVDAVLRQQLLGEDEGWLSEESADDLSRLEKNRVWIVDPLDGTREFVAGIPEFCVSVALVEDGRPVVGGICNPASNEIFLGAVDSGLTYNGKPARPSQRTSLEGAVVLASRSEMKRGEWKQFEKTLPKVRPLGSVAYKLALVAAGLADVTFTLTPKHEWDVAGGVALVNSGGGFVSTLHHTALRCNHSCTLISGLLACAPLLRDQVLALVSHHWPANSGLSR